MKKYRMIFFTILLSLAVVQTQSDTLASSKSEVQKAPEPSPVIELGIDSVMQNKDGSYRMAMYMLNAEPVAGYQMDFLPPGVVKPVSIHGGISEELGYMMKSSENGKVLGFSMQGTAIPVSSSQKPSDNILYYLDVTFDGKPGQEIFIQFKSVVAGAKGVKLEAVDLPYKFTLK